jgi:hypothetical protein
MSACLFAPMIKMESGTRLSVYSCAVLIFSRFDASATAAVILGYFASGVVVPKSSYLSFTESGCISQDLEKLLVEIPYSGRSL